MKAGAAVLVLVAALAAGGAAAARTPTPSQKAAIVAAMRSEQGNVAIQKILVSTANPSFASMNWGFANNGLSALHSSLLGRRQGRVEGALDARPRGARRRRLRLRARAGGARPASRGLPAAPRRSTPGTATRVERKGILAGFRSSDLTPVREEGARALATSASRGANRSWAGGVASFESGSTVYVFFQHTKGWQPVFESLLQQTPLPPAAIVLSLASCVGYNPADYNA